MSPTSSPRPERPADVLTWPVVGGLLRWPRLRTTAQIAVGAVALVSVVHGLFGPPFAPTNLATLLTWIHYRGLLIGALLVAGNAFCHACPMVLARDAARRLHPPTRPWPRWLKGKWLAIALFAAVLFAYERFDLWALPAARATAPRPQSFSRLPTTAKAFPRPRRSDSGCAPCASVCAPKAAHSPWRPTHLSAPSSTSLFPSPPSRPGRNG